MHIDSSLQNAHLCLCTSSKTLFVYPATFLLQAGFKFWLAANSIAAHYIVLRQAWRLRMGLYSGGKKTTNKHTHAQKVNRQSPVKAMMRDWWCVQHKQLSHKWFASSQLLTRLQRSDEVLWGLWLDSPLVAWMVSRKQTDDFCMCKCFHLAYTGWNESR